jgi:prepilin-type processing-associated H-X9-DG protein
VYLGVAGKDSAFGIPDQTGRQSAASGQRLSAIVDGLSNTIMAVEVSDELAVPWTKPDSEIDIQNMEPWRFYGQFPGGVNVVFCDGATRFLSYVDDTVWKVFLQINDGEVPPSLDSDW